MRSEKELSIALSVATQLYGILGHPVEHSLSPLMQTFAFQHHDLDCIYVPFPVLPDHLASALTGAIALGVRGLNVTIPHKETILPWLDTVSDEAQFVGAVNTVVISTQHDPTVNGAEDPKTVVKQIQNDLTEQVVNEIIPAELEVTVGEVLTRGGLRLSPQRRCPG